MEQEEGSVALMRELIRQQRGFDAEELAVIHEQAAQLDGGVVGVADFDGEWCGTGRIRFPFPPKKGTGAFLESLLTKGIVFDIWRFGQPRRIDGFEVSISKDITLKIG